MHPNNELTPPFIVPWDIRARNGAVTQEFSVKEGRYYQFQIAFQGAVTGVTTEERLSQLRELHKFTGDGSTIWVTKGSANSDKPQRVPEDIVAAQLEEGIRRGDYVARMQETGVMIPVHLVVTSLPTATAPAAIVFENTIDTWSIDAGTKDGIVRGIASVPLHPGVFRVSATTLQATSVPANVHTALRVTYRPDTQPS